MENIDLVPKENILLKPFYFVKRTVRVSLFTVLIPFFAFGALCVACGIAFLAVWHRLFCIIDNWGE